MDSPLPNIVATFRAAWRHRWLGMVVAWVIAAIGVVGIVFLKERFEATASVYVDTQSVLKPLMTGLAFQPDFDQQVRMLARTLISRPNVEKLVRTPELRFEADDSKELVSTIDKLLETIKITPSGAGGNLYIISYRDTDPQRARRLVERLVAMFVESGLGEKQRDSRGAAEFIDEQIRTYEAKLSEAESRLKDFKLRNFGLTGTSNQDYFSRISALTEAVGKLRGDLRAAEQSRDALKRELSSENPQLPLDAPSATGTAVVPDPEVVRLEGLRRQLDELLRRYTDEHPDVIATRRAISMLEAQRRLELQERAKVSAGDRHAAATNPVFQRIRIAAAEAEANVASLRSQLAEQQGRLDQIRATAGRVPQVEAELAQLNRDYEVIRQKYEQLVTRRESASLGQKLDQSAQVADFRLVEPPRVSPKPVPPSRVHLAALTILLSIVGGAGAAYSVAAARPTVDSLKVLLAVSGRPVLGGASMFVSQRSRALDRRYVILFIGLLVTLMVVQLIWTVLLSLSSGRL